MSPPWGSRDAPEEQESALNSKKTGKEEEVRPSLAARFDTTFTLVVRRQSRGTCRYHQKAQGMDLPAHSMTLYPEVKNRMDFSALGYEDDPAQSGGRLNVILGRGSPR